MDTASSLVSRHGRNLALPLAALVLAGVVLILLAFIAGSLDAGTGATSPENQLAPFRWGPISDKLG
ncbi:hypothetical protein BH24CHL8_BH24CHL8_05040 [soil metagenome]